MLIWIGKEKGIECLPGFPARDLSEQEVKVYGERRLLSTGLWKKREDKADRRDTSGKDD